MTGGGGGDFIDEGTFFAKIWKEMAKSAKKIFNYFLKEKKPLWV